jgi:hypothetical protein
MLNFFLKVLPQLLSRKFSSGVRRLLIVARYNKAHLLLKDGHFS